MKMLLAAILILSGYSLNAQAPVAQWLKRVGSTGLDQPNSMVLDASGNIYIAGTFSGTVDFDPSAATAALASVGTTNMFFAKYDPNGNYIWAKCITGGSGLINIAVDAAQNVYLGGSIMNGTLYDFDPSSAVVNLTSLGSQDIYIAKYTPAGNFSWVKRIGSTDLEYVRAIDVDASGNVYTAGIFRSTTDFDPGAAVFNLTENNAGSASDAFISKLTTDGDFVWAKGVGGTGFDAAYGLKVDNAHVYVTGHFDETVDFNPGAGVYNLTVAQPGHSDQDAFLLKLTIAGNFVWARNTAHGNGSAKGENIALDAAGNVYTTGWFSGIDTDFDPGIGSVQLSNLNGIKSFVSKLDINGDFIWANKITATNGDPVFGKDIALDSAENCYLSAYFNVDANVVLPSGTSHFVSNGDYDGLITKVNPAGDFLWAKAFGGTGYDQLFALQLDDSGNIFATGSFSNTITMDAFNLTSAGNSDVFFVKLLHSNCNSSTSTLNVSNCSSYTVPSGHEIYTASGTYTDTIPNAAGCDSIITINLTIGDALAPVANAATLANVTGQCSVTSLTAPTAMDNCAGTITGTHNATLPITAQGTTVVIWTYTDGNGNSSTQTQNVIIEDNTAPVASIANLADVTGQCSVTSLTAPTATDNCAGTITGTHSTTLPITTPGTTVVTWTYNDGSGNASTQTQQVIVTLPVATTTLSGITISATTSGATYQWINCGTGNTPIAGATSQSFTATANGTYAVIVTQNGCSSTSVCVTISTVGMEEFSQTLFTVYPNPNNGTFKIVTEMQATITITNAAGQWIATHPLKSGENTIELSHVESGVYFISAIHPNGQTVIQRVSVF